MRSNKGFCGGWKEKWNGFWGGDVPSNKITPLHLPKQQMFPWSGWGASLWSKTSTQVAIFSPSGKIPRYTSCDLARRNFLENEKLFQQQVKRNSGKFHFDDVPAHAVTERYVPLNWNSRMIHKPIAFSMSSNWAEMFEWTVVFYANTRAVDLEMTMVYHKHSESSLAWKKKIVTTLKLVSNCSYTSTIPFGIGGEFKKKKVWIRLLKIMQLICILKELVTIIFRWTFFFLLKQKDNIRGDLEWERIHYNSLYSSY